MKNILFFPEKGAFAAQLRNEAHVAVRQGAVFYIVDPCFVITVDHFEL